MVDLTEAVQGRIDRFRGRSDPEKRPEGARRVQMGFFAVPAAPRPRRQGQSQRAGAADREHRVDRPVPRGR
jgi:hypothetical protein